MEYLCLYCSIEVRDDDMAVSCDSCNEWCHITCDTGISEEDYQAMVGGQAIIWSCLVCRTNAVEVRASNLSPLVPIRIIQEEDIEVELPDVEVQDIIDLTYELVASGNQRKGDLLTDSRGYTYTKKVDNRSSTVHWKCTHKNRPLLCKAGVVERNDGYVRTPCGNAHEHVCLPDLTKVKFVKMRTSLLERGSKEQHTSASVLIDDQLLVDNDLVACMPKKSLLIDYINKCRASGRPRDVTGTSFQINLEHIPTNLYTTNKNVM